MTEELGALIERRLASLPEPTRGLLGSAVAPDAPDPWIRDVLLAYLRYFTRRFDLDEPAPAADADWESVPYPEVAAAAQALLDEDTDRLAASD